MRVSGHLCGLRQRALLLQRAVRHVRRRSLHVWELPDLQQRPLCVSDALRGLWKSALRLLYRMRSLLERALRMRNALCALRQPDVWRRLPELFDVSAESLCVPQPVSELWIHALCVSAGVPDMRSSALRVSTGVSRLPSGTVQLPAADDVHALRRHLA